jgi:thiol-disulfide isomerase/thioredoxin
MKSNYLQIVFLFFVCFCFAQKRPKNFSVAVHENIKRYNVYANVAYEKGDLEQGKFLFDTLVNNQLIGTKFLDYNFKRASGRKLYLSEFKKPILLQTYATWCVLNRGEVPAINKLAQKYKDKIQVIVVFWGKKQAVKGLQNLFNGAVEVCYANESYTKDEEVVATLKYAMGFMNSYYLDQNLMVVSIKKSQENILPKNIPMKEAIKINMNNYEKSFAELLLKNQMVKENLVKK